MQAIVKASDINGTVAVPASKSMAQRVCAAALLHGGRTIISNYGTSNDEQAALNIIKDLGAEVITTDDGLLIVDSKGVQPKKSTVHCGESGLSARLFTPLVALSDQELAVTGEGSLLSRPMNEHKAVLEQLDVSVEGESIPLKIKGPLVAKNIEMDGSVSSQYLSGVLMAYGFTAKEPVTITVHNLKSKPYIDLTLDVLRQFGRKVEHEDYTLFKIEPVEFDETPDVYASIEGDWSSATSLLVAGALNGELVADGVNSNSLQADKAIVDVLKLTGAEVEMDSYKTTVKKAEKLQSFSYDATDAPDLFPVLSILAAKSEGRSTIKGTNRLIHKESNRLESVTAMLAKLGVVYTTDEDELSIDGVEQFNACTIDSYNDHRLVMAGAIAGLSADGEVIIENAEAVNKSYPDFFSHLSSLGADCILKD